MGSSYEVRCDFQRMKNGARREAVGGIATTFALPFSVSAFQMPLQLLRRW